jgi:Family of unknown function (DUF6800)
MFHVKHISIFSAYLRASFWSQPGCHVQSLGGVSAGFYGPTPISQGVPGVCMSAPSRRPEIRRRRTRKEKIVKLRKRLAAASSESRTRIEQKLHRIALVSPGNPLLKA